jgi:L-ascorbate metabolism protein UlaG (beta-lactamase superfamily)
MELTKHAHACVTLDKGNGHLLVDPGIFNQNAAELVAAASTILITHEHPDHVDEPALTAALEARPELKIYGPEAVVGRWRDRAGQVTAVGDGDRFQAEGFEITVFGELHALIHHDIPQVANVGYLIDGQVYHPGDSYHVPPVPVPTLLLPTSGPWASFGQAIDFVREIGPQNVVQIHELLLSEVGQQMMTSLISPKGLTEAQLAIVPVGDTITV